MALFMDKVYGVKATEPLQGVSLFFTTKSKGGPSIHLIDLGRMKRRVNFGTRKWF